MTEQDGAILGTIIGVISAVVSACVFWLYRAGNSYAHTLLARAKEVEMQSRELERKSEHCLMLAQQHRLELLERQQAISRIKPQPPTATPRPYYPGYF